MTRATGSSEYRRGAEVPANLTEMDGNSADGADAQNGGVMPNTRSRTPRRSPGTIIIRVSEVRVPPPASLVEPIAPPKGRVWTEHAEMRLSDRRLEASEVEQGIRDGHRTFTV
jgi:hypothetical protein